MPGVLADQDRGLPPPPGLERPHAILAAVHESLLIEHAVGRQKNLAMHVTHFRLLFAERDVERRVVDVILEALVESDDDVDRGTLVGCGQIARERAGSDRELLHAAFDEIPRGGRLGEDDELRLGIEQRSLRDNGTDPRDVFCVLALARAKLGERHPDTRHAGKILASGRRWSSP